MMGACENPYAFPRNDAKFPTVQAGMSLRDYFAGQAIIALINMSMTDAQGYALPIAEREPARARVAYRLADALLAARTPTNKDKP